MTEPYHFEEFMRLCGQGLAALGSDLNSVTTIKGRMEAAGFINITEEVFKCPVGIWPKDKRLKLVGLYWRTAIMDGLPGLSYRPFGKGLGWSPEAIEVFLVRVRKSLMDTTKHTYFPFHVIYGQKPVHGTKAKT